jgi:hypothetical protein
MAENKQYKDLVFDRSEYTGAARSSVRIRPLRRAVLRIASMGWLAVPLNLQELPEVADGETP